MNNFEFISYQETPNDKYGMIAIITIRLYGKVIVRYKKMQAKTGGDFFASPSFTVENNGEKKYINTHMLDSRAEDELLMEFIRGKCHEYEIKKSTYRIEKNSQTSFKETTPTQTYDEGVIPF